LELRQARWGLPRSAGRGDGCPSALRSGLLDWDECSPGRLRSGAERTSSGSLKNLAPPLLDKGVLIMLRCAEIFVRRGEGSRRRLTSHTRPDQPEGTLVSKSRRGTYPPPPKRTEWCSGIGAKQGLARRDRTCGRAIRGVLSRDSQDPASDLTGGGDAGKIEPNPYLGGVYGNCTSGMSARIFSDATTEREVVATADAACCCMGILLAKSRLAPS
jgi:hypothetical protein